MSVVTQLLATLLPDLIVAPIVVPLMTAAVMLALGESRRGANAVLNVASTLGTLCVCAALLVAVARNDVPAAVVAYLPANWSVPFGIALAIDRLSALMLVLASIIASASLLFACARWHRAGVHFHPLFQLQLMGINGAFLTADLFNLFVFFEVMLAASYGLLLHGSGRRRVRAGLHYLTINLMASTLFLAGVGVLYGIAGTLNLADLAQKLPHIPAADRGLLHAGAALLGLAFLIKAAAWPLNAWLAPAYSAAGAPVAALFVLLTKVGVYSVLRLWALLMHGETDALALFGANALVWGGFVTLTIASIAMLASMNVERLAGFGVVMSSGTLLAAIGFDHPTVVGGALFYLLASTLACSALFLVGDLVERARAGAASDAPIHVEQTDHLPFYLEMRDVDGATNLDDREGALVGQPVPWAVAFVGVSFVAFALVIAGLPPTPAFIAKFAMLDALVGVRQGAELPARVISLEGWAMLTLLLTSGVFAMVALSRAGIRYFWAPQQRPPPALRALECTPVVLLLAACAGLVIAPAPVLAYATEAAKAVLQPTSYIETIMSARPVPPRQTRGQQ